MSEDVKIRSTNTHMLMLSLDECETVASALRFYRASVCENNRDAVIEELLTRIAEAEAREKTKQMVRAAFIQPVDYAGQQAEAIGQVSAFAMQPTPWPSVFAGEDAT